MTSWSGSRKPTNELPKRPPEPTTTISFAPFTSESFVSAPIQSPGLIQRNQHIIFEPRLTAAGAPFGQRFPPGTKDARCSRAGRLPAESPPSRNIRRSTAPFESDMLPKVHPDFPRTLSKFLELPLHLWAGPTKRSTSRQHIVDHGIDLRLMLRRVQPDSGSRLARMHPPPAPGIRHMNGRRGETGAQIPVKITQRTPVRLVEAHLVNSDRRISNCVTEE